MREGMARERGVVHLDVQFEILQQIELAQKPNHGGGVEIILVLCRLAGFRFDEQRALETLRRA